MPFDDVLVRFKNLTVVGTKAVRQPASASLKSRAAAALQVRGQLCVCGLWWGEWRW